jgi:hypothetical protein
VYLNQGLIHFVSETLETKAVEQLKGLANLIGAIWNPVEKKKPVSHEI